MRTSYRQQSHPAPHRHRTSLGGLFFALSAAPCAWLVEHLVGYGLSSRACYPGSRQLTSPIASWAAMRPALVFLALTCLGLALLGGWIAGRSWRATRTETAGEADDLLEIGAGRSRWMAACGILVTVLFAAAILVDGLVLAAAPTCRG